MDKETAFVVEGDPIEWEMTPVRDEHAAVNTYTCFPTLLDVCVNGKEHKLSQQIPNEPKKQNEPGKGIYCTTCRRPLAAHFQSVPVLW